MAYATGAQLKDELQGGDATFTRDDDLFDTLVEEASAAIDAYTFRTFEVPEVATARTFTPGRWGDLYGLPDIASTTDLALEYLTGSSTWTAANPSTYWVHTYQGGDGVEAPGMVKSINAVTRFACGDAGRPSVRVTARWGWPETPAVVHRACLLWARRIYTRKDSPSGVLGFGDMGAVRLSSVDPDIQRLLGPYRRKGLLIG